MANIQEIFINFMLLVLFVFGIFSLIIYIQNDNNAQNQLIDNEIFGGSNGSYNQLKNAINSAQNSSQTQYKLFSDEKPQASLGSIVLFQIVGSAKTFTALTLGFFNVLIKLPITVLGIDPLIYSIILSALTIILIIALWYLYKIGG